MTSQVPLSPPRARQLILVLGLVSALGSMATHMLVPALPMMQHDLGTGVAGAQMVVGAYLAGLGLGQLLAGPLVDRLGREQVLKGGLALFVIGSLACAIAPGIGGLLAARLMQACGGAAGLVTARVLVADHFHADEGAARQASLMMVVLISPALSPVLGGVIVSAFGWRPIFAVLLLLGLLAAALAMRAAAGAGRRPPLARAPGQTLLGDVRRLAGNRNFVLATCALAAASGTLYMFLASSTFLLERQFGLDARATGGIVGPAPLVGPLMFLGLGAGLAGPSAIHIAINAEAGLAGTGASLAGATQMLVSGAATVPLGWFAPINPFKLTFSLACASGLSFLAALLRQMAVRAMPRRGAA